MTEANNASSSTVETESLDRIKQIAITGSVDIQWVDLQASLKSRLEQVIEMYQEQTDCKENQYNEPNVEKFNLDYSRDEIMELIASFTEPPFTIQRICELLSWPDKYYDKIGSFLRGLEKNLRVISSNDWPKCPPASITNHRPKVNHQPTDMSPPSTSSTHPMSVDDSNANQDGREGDNHDANQAGREDDNNNQPPLAPSDEQIPETHKQSGEEVPQGSEANECAAVGVDLGVGASDGEATGEPVT